MRSWNCWQARRRIPRWIRGACSPSEANSVTRHLAVCAACAADAALERALCRAAVPASEPARADLWARVEQATLAAATFAAESRPGAAPDRSRARSAALLATPARLSLGAAVLVAALLLAGRMGTGGGPGLGSNSAPGGALEPATPTAAQSARLDLLLWESQPAAADPLGPTTQGWLALLDEGG